MLRFSTEKLAGLIRELPESDCTGLQQVNEDCSDGYTYLYNNMFLPFYKNPDSDFTLDTDMFKLEDIYELYQHYSKVDAQMEKSLSVVRMFSACKPARKTVNFL